MILMVKCTTRSKTFTMQSAESCVRINGKLTNWFSCKTCAIQGDILSPTLFSVFINDLVQDTLYKQPEFKGRTN